MERVRLTGRRGLFDEEEVQDMVTGFDPRVHAKVEQVVIEPQPEEIDLRSTIRKLWRWRSARCRKCRNRRSGKSKNWGS